MTKIDWQQGELLHVPTTPPVRGFVASGHSRTYRYVDDNEVDRVEPRQPTSGESFSDPGVQILASEVATLRSTIDMVLERQQSIVKCNEELKLQIEKLTQSDVVTSTRKRKTSLSVQVQIPYSIQYTTFYHFSLSTYRTKFESFTILWTKRIN